jgi:hypothetical protein
VQSKSSVGLILSRISPLRRRGHFEKFSTHDAAYPASVLETVCIQDILLKAEGIK